MFSKSQKHQIAAEIEKLLLSFNHPEMPKERPSFKLHVQGLEPWSWADIDPNWMFGASNPPSVNPGTKCRQRNKPKGEQDDL